jgi:hypothetical protein
MEAAVYQQFFFQASDDFETVPAVKAHVDFLFRVVR